MKKSISVWSFPFDWSLEKKLQLASAAGFEGFEIDLTEDGPVNLRSSSAELGAIRSAAEKAGLTLSGLATGLYWNANAASGDPAIREKAAHILRRQIECAAALGIDTILVVPGTVGVDFIPGAEVVRYDIAYERARAFLQVSLPIAAQHHVVLAAENVWNKFLLSPLEFRDFIDSFGSEWVAAYYDVGNTLATGYPEHWIPILNRRIRRVHVKDYRRAVGSTHGFVELFSGDVQWPAVMKALRTAGYHEWLTAEMIPPVPFYQHCPDVLIHNTARALDALLALT